MVKRPPRVPGVRSRLSSGQLRAHVSDYRYIRIIGGNGRGGISNEP